MHVRVADPRRGVLMRRNTMLVRGRGLRGLGADCGPNPCTWGDYLSVTGVVSPACLQWQQLCSAEGKAISSGERAIGQNIAQSVETSFDQTLSNLFGTAPPDPDQPPAPTSGINWTMVGIAAVVGFVAFKVFVK